MDISPTIIPKSDQLNSDDLIAGPITITVTAVSPGSNEQPVAIGYAGDAGRPYKPSKSMRRVLVTMWGSEGSAYVGRRLTLYRDPAIKFGGDQVGGIRISHASDIAQPVVLALTESRGRRKPFRVEPLADDARKHTARDLQTLSDIAATKVAAGAEALTEWAQTLSAEEKRTIGAERFAGWKADASKRNQQIREPVQL